MANGATAAGQIRDIQESQNALTRVYGLLLKALKSVLDDLSLSFFCWEPHEYSEIPKKFLWNKPCWDTEHYSVFSHLPLIHSWHHFVNMPIDDFKAREAAEPGQAIVSLQILTNVALLDIDYAETDEKDWPTSLPLGESLARAFVYKTARKSDSSLWNLWEECPWVENAGPEGQAFDTKFPELSAWARAFDLIAFLENPKPLIKEIGAFLGQPAG
jgi:hypothetical protein